MWWYLRARQLLRLRQRLIERHELQVVEGTPRHSVVQLLHVPPAVLAIAHTDNNNRQRQVRRLHECVDGIPLLRAQLMSGEIGAACHLPVADDDRNVEGAARAFDNVHSLAYDRTKAGGPS
jgi:hypothetical protein